MSRKNQKQMTPGMLRQAVIGSFIKLNPLYMMKNPVMFVVEVGFFITLILSVFPGLFGDTGANLRTYNAIVSAVLFVTVLFANFAESIAEGRGKAQAASLKKTQKDTKARRLAEDGSETVILSSELKKDDIVLVSAGEIIPATARSLRALLRWMSPPSQVNPLRLSGSRAEISARSPAAPPLYPTGSRSASPPTPATASLTA